MTRSTMRVAKQIAKQETERAAVLRKDFLVSWTVEVDVGLRISIYGMMNMDRFGVNFLDR